MCWMCLCSYKRALAKTKQQDPARHSSVFKKERSHKSEEERRQEKERKREKYMNSKMPKRPDVTKLENSLSSGGGQDSNSHSHHHHSSSAFHPPPLKAAKREREGDTDHVGEITQLKERIAALEKQCGMKDRQLIAKDQEITQMKAKVFNEERLIREKMKLMAKSHDDKVNDLQKKTRELQSEISRMRRESKPNQKNKKVDNLFKQSSKPKVASRTASPLSRSRSRSPVRSRSVSKPRSASGSRSASPAAEANAISTTTISTNDNGVVVTALNGNGAKEGSTSPRRSPSRSPSVSSRSRSSSPIRRETIAT